ncbi:RimJ/RimL family protein N-acetyltransferase [Mumia flava]|uniref:RimJ/RimL family protein N-acetyltransferase n=1 Tax=Mumia flava TaxID=1348852 RepID=A0A0B2BU55_9ACTN|nr:GNAT family protein [Mumia flava]PJJ57026.1 RimJ/RimL family protein N-acetyltransferase [Mumia flava]
MRPSQWYEAQDLFGDHVTLAQLRPHHAEGVLAASDDDAVFRWLSFDRPADLAAAEKIVTGYLAIPDSVAWAQIDTKSGDLAGLTTFYDIDPARRGVKIGWTWLGERFQRSGINTEAKLMLLSHAFDTLGAVRVAWETDVLNEQSQAAIERLGATREGVLRKHRPRKDGSWRDTVVYSVTDEEWPQVRTALRAALDSAS